MSRAEAKAAILAAINGTDLGDLILLDGRWIPTVRRDLDVEEASAFSGGYESNGLLVEGMRLTVDGALLAYAPVVGGGMMVGDKQYKVRLVSESGNRLRITLTRYSS